MWLAIVSGFELFAAIKKTYSPRYWSWSCSIGCRNTRTVTWIFFNKNIFVKDLLAAGYGEWSMSIGDPGKAIRVGVWFYKRSYQSCTNLGIPFNCCPLFNLARSYQDHTNLVPIIPRSYQSWYNF